MSDHAVGREQATRRFAYALLWLSIFTIAWQGTFELGGLTKAVGFLAAAAGAFAVVVTGRRTRLTDVHALVIAFTAWCGLSLLWTVDNGLTVTSVSTMFELLTLVLLTLEFASDGDRADSLARAYVLGCVVLAFEVIGAQLSGNIQDNRVRVGSLQPNDVAYTLCLAMPFAWYLARRTTTMRRAGYVGFIVVALYAVVLTASRGGLLLGGVACLIIPWTLVEGNRRRLYALGLVVLLAMPIVITKLPSQQVTRLSTTSSDIESGDLNNRTELWAAAWDIWSDHPILGIGAGATRDGIEARTGFLLGAHNTFLDVVSGLGIVGLVLFCLVLLAAYRRSSRATGLAKKLVVVQALVVLVGIQVRHWEFEKALWATIVITMAIAAADDGRRRRAVAYAGDSESELAAPAGLAR